MDCHILRSMYFVVEEVAGAAVGMQDIVLVRMVECILVDIVVGIHNLHTL
jgi:hypothetical protein